MTLVNRCTQYICTYIALSELQDGLDGEGVALCASGQGRLEFHHLRDPDSILVVTWGHHCCPVRVRGWGQGLSHGHTINGDVQDVWQITQLQKIVQLQITKLQNIGQLQNCFLI